MDASLKRYQEATTAAREDWGTRFQDMHKAYQEEMEELKQCTSQMVEKIQEQQRLKDSVQRSKASQLEQQIWGEEWQKAKEDWMETERLLQETLEQEKIC